MSGLCLWLRRVFCDHRWSWEHGHGWSRRTCRVCGEDEWMA
jgi:hypothetical protein